MAYKALYRVYRPQLFREVVGQEVIVKTLQNSIANNKISHAYLFNGPRGTGKTSIARIFAKVLNCENPVLLEPCDKCNSCHDITDGISSDVIEIDAASNNGVDEIRDIREKVKFLPSGSKYKIYIIDEVHMLSSGAFNALLKTLEEPPQHAIFILATTEPQKLPETIISRCQRFDFKTLTVNEISKKIRNICSAENVEITEEAVNGISESAEGALRDALTILDQAISYSDEKVTIEDVNLVTGNLSYDRLINLASFFDVGNINGALEEVNQLIDMGKEASKLVSSLLQFYRDILLYKNVDSVMYSKYIFEKEKFKQIANSTSEARIFYYIDILSDVQIKMRYSTTPRTYLEIAIIKMINTTNNDLDFVKRIDELEKSVANIKVGEPGSVNDEKLNLLEIRLNKVVSELNKLEIHKLVEKVNNLENVRTENNGTLDNVSKDVVKQINSINEELLFLKTNLNNIKNEISDISENGVSTSNVGDFDRNELESIVKQMTSRIDSKISYLQEDINTLKLEIIKVSNDKFDQKESIMNNHDFAELKGKVISIERRIFEILAGELSQKTPKEKKKVKGQLGLFEDIVVTEVPEVEPEVDFKHLSKQEEQATEVKEVITHKDSNEPKTELYVNNDTLEDEEIIEEDTITYSEKVENISPTTSQTNQHTSKNIIDSEYDDEKPRSQLVINNRNDDNIFEKERELFEKEISSIRPSIQIKGSSEKNEDIKEAKVGNSDVISKETSYLGYDIKVVEQILHDSRSESARNDSKRVLKLWEKIGENATTEMMGIIELLRKGNVVAVGNKQFIITYPSSIQCNQVMRTTFKDKSLKVLYRELGGAYDYIALPENIWLEKRREYISQYNIGYKYPKLTPIDDPNLIVITTQYQDPKDSIVNKTIELFGDEIVKVE